MSFDLCCIIFGILVFCSETDGGSLTWEKPLPIQTVQSSNPVDHFSSRQLHEGTINATLNWRFRLNQLNFGSLVISLNGTHIAGIGSSGSGPQAGFENEFGIVWNPKQKLVKLVIFKVTTEKSGTFTCQVNVDEVTGFVTKNFQFRSAVQVHVVVSPKVTLKEKFFVGREQTASLFCQVKGNPKPTISWSHCDPPHVSCNKQYLKILKVQDARTNYNCTARNAVGIDSATTVLIIGGYNIYLKMAIIEECDMKYSVWEALKKEFTKIFEKNTTESYSGAELINSSCGFSLIVHVVLKFSTEVAEDDSISLIQSVIVDGKLGELSVWYIHGISRSFRIITPVPPRTGILINDINKPEHSECCDMCKAEVITGVTLACFVCGLVIGAAWFMVSLKRGYFKQKRNSLFVRDQAAIQEMNRTVNSNYDGQSL